MSTLQSTPTVLPRSAVLALGGVLLVSLAAVAWARYTGLDPRERDAPTVSQRQLVFADTASGAITVTDARTKAPIATLQGEQGFVRGVLRSLMRERKRRGLPLNEPLQLLARADGRLTLQDPLTSHRIDLEAFGIDNVAAFARWVPTKGNQTP